MSHQHRPTLTPLRPRDQAQPSQRPADELPALQGGTTLGEFKGIASEKDGAKEDLKKIDLLKAFQHLFPGRTVLNTQGHETRVSCFNESGHSNGDRNPSMSINNSTNVYTCFGCEASGDILDMVAYKQGYADSNQRCPHDQVHQAVFDANNLFKLGWEFHTVDGKHYRGPARVSSLANEASSPKATSGLGSGNVIEFPSDYEPMPIVPPKKDFREIDWRNLLENDTAFRHYMELVTVDDVADEYHFWNFMILLGLLIGRDVAIPDYRPVYGNLFVCLNGPTSAGKSRSMSYITSLIGKDELKFDNDDPYSDGIKSISGTASGEALAAAFIHRSDDPNYNPVAPITPGAPAPKRKKVIPQVEHPVRGLVQIEELSSMANKAESKNSIIKQMMIELYDCKDLVGSSSLTNTYEARDPFACVLSSVQPEVLKGIFSGSNDSASGFLNRWLFISGKKKQRQAIGKPLDLDSMIPWLQEIKQWASDIKSSGGYLEFVYDKDKKRFEDFCKKNIYCYEDTNGLQRVHVLLKKFILLGCAVYMEDNITERVLDFAEYLLLWIIDLNEFQEIADLDAKVETRIENAIIDALASPEPNKKTGEPEYGISKSMLEKIVKNKLGTSAFTSREFEYVIARLRTNNVICFTGPIKTGKRGRPMERYFHPNYWDYWDKVVAESEKNN